jgi:hypothetical protein
MTIRRPQSSKMSRSITGGRQVPTAQVKKANRGKIRETLDAELRRKTRVPDEKMNCRVTI